MTATMTIRAEDIFAAAQLVMRAGEIRDASNTPETSAALDEARHTFQRLYTEAGETAKEGYARLREGKPAQPDAIDLKALRRRASRLVGTRPKGPKQPGQYTNEEEARADMTARRAAARKAMETGALSERDYKVVDAVLTKAEVAGSAEVLMSLTEGAKRSGLHREAFRRGLRALSKDAVWLEVLDHPERDDNVRYWNNHPGMSANAVKVRSGVRPASWPAARSTRSPETSRQTPRHRGRQRTALADA